MDLTMEVSMRSESTVSPFRYGLSRIMIDSSAVYAVIFFRSFVFLRINFSRLPFSRRARSFSCATSRRGADAASFEAKVNSAMFFADKVSRCAILSNAFMRVWPSGKAKASQAFIRGFESRHPLQVYASRRWVSVGGFFCFVRNALRALLSYDPSTSCRMRRGVLLRALVSDFRVPGHNFKGMYVPFLSVGDIRQS